MQSLCELPTGDDACVLGIEHVEDVIFIDVLVGIVDSEEVQEMLEIEIVGDALPLRGACGLLDEFAKLFVVGALVAEKFNNLSKLVEMDVAILVDIEEVEDVLEVGDGAGGDVVF